MSPLPSPAPSQRVHYVGEDGCEEGVVGSLVSGSEERRIFVILDGSHPSYVMARHDEETKARGTWHFPAA